MLPGYIWLQLIPIVYIFHIVRVTCSRSCQTIFLTVENYGPFVFVDLLLLEINPFFCLFRFKNAAVKTKNAFILMIPKRPQPKLMKPLEVFLWFQRALDQSPSWVGCCKSRLEGHTLKKAPHLQIIVFLKNPLLEAQ